jgi:hypothetical protein
VEETDESLAVKAKGKSRRAKQLRKQMELLTLCRSAHKTDIKSYLSTLVSQIDSLYSDKRSINLFFPAYFLFNIPIKCTIFQIHKQKESRKKFSVLAKWLSAWSKCTPQLLYFLHKIYT